jgi:hypothetical protein
MTSLAAAWRTRNSLLCVGLDPDPDTDRRKRLWTVSSSSTSSGVHLREPLAREEYGPHGATFDRSAIHLDDHLGCLGTVLGSPVVLGGREQARIDQATPCHQRRDELFGRQAARYYGGTMTWGTSSTTGVGSGLMNRQELTII